MRTDDLVAALARDAEPVKRRPVVRLAIAAALGAVAAVPVMLWQLGMNPSLMADARTAMFWVKLAFVAAIAAIGWWIVRCVAQPGARPRRALRALAAPLVAMALLAAVVLLAAPADQRMEMLMGSSWDSCPFNIALLAAPALVLLMAAVHSLAPTRLRLAGAGVGLLAGALGALVYTVHCPEFAAPFLIVWYVLGMLIPAVIGALIGPRVLRW
jgi:hypothetical protein